MTGGQKKAAAGGVVVGALLLWWFFRRRTDHPGEAGGAVSFGDRTSVTYYKKEDANGVMECWKAVGGDYEATPDVRVPMSECWSADDLPDVLNPWNWA